MAIHIKNCGLRTTADIETAVSSGADYLGFLHYTPSPRHIELNDAISLMQHIPSSVRSVAVLVNPDDALLDDIAQRWRPDYVQLHGDESIERVREIRSRYGIPLIKAIGVCDATDINAASDYAAEVDMLLFDTKAPSTNDLPGGRGESFDWTLLKDLDVNIPWFLAGGITADNVAEALQISGARMVDVSSALESEPGVKDPNKITAFNQAVHAFEREMAGTS